MCGIVAILSRPSTREVPAAAELIRLLDAAVAAGALADAAQLTARVDSLLKGVPGVLALLADADLGPALIAGLDRAGLSAEALERANAELIDLLDATWAVRRDRLRTAAAVADLVDGALAGSDGVRRAAVGGYLAIQQ